MRVLVCGSRTLGTSEQLVRMFAVLDALHGLDNVACLIHGGAKGADFQADHWARDHGIGREVYNADWARYGKPAGMIRNQQMMDEGKPDLVVAFTDKPLNQSRGTSNMVGIAVRASVKIWSIEL